MGVQVRPGENPTRLAALMRAAIERCQLDLSGRIVLTEAASGAYVVTPVLAALGGADRVYALARPSRYGTIAEVTAWTGMLAAVVGCQDRIELVTEKSARLLAIADIVTNSGHLRPIDAATVAALRPGTAVPLMYESWELRDSDVDVAACQQHGVLVAGTNERHPAVDVFSFLGVQAIKQLLDAGVAVVGSRVLLLCDNPFRPFIERGLVGAGATVETAKRFPTPEAGSPGHGAAYDAIMVALRPRGGPVLPAGAVAAAAYGMPGAVVIQFWGDIDREACARFGVVYWPLEPPPPGHMGALPSAVGPEPVVRLQAGGLKVGELLSSGMAPIGADAAFLQPLEQSTEAVS